MSAATSVESQPAESPVNKVDTAKAGIATVVKTPAAAPAVSPSAAPTTNAAPSPINPKASTKPNITEEALAAMSLQMSTKVMTDNDIAAAFKLFYDRAPTKQDDLSIYKGMSSKQILEIFYTAPEFLARPGVATLVLGAAKKMQDLKNKS